MPSRKFVWDPGHWRLRAEETRTVADQMTHEAARTIMRRIANDYDPLALHHAHPMASASVKIISDTVTKWREAGHPLRNHSTSTQFEVTPARLRTAPAMKQQWASFSGFLKDMPVAPRPHF